MGNPLDAELLAAHSAQDTASLVRLYTQAADDAPDVDASCFYLTHAYVFALDAGLDDAKNLSRRLAAHGREVPL